MWSTLLPVFRGQIKHTHTLGVCVVVGLMEQILSVDVCKIKCESESVVTASYNHSNHGYTVC